MSEASGCHDDRVVSLAARYECGEHVAVWEELRHQPVSAADAAAVAEATMRRVARNVDVVVDRLRAAGWRWAYQERVRQAPTDDDLRAIAAVEERQGPLPVALRACLMHVGEVCLCGTLPGWEPPWYWFDDFVLDPGTYPVMGDPLVLPRTAWMAEDWPSWMAGDLAGLGSDDGVEPRRLYLFAPDEVRKAGMSGGDHYLMLPPAAADPPLVGVEHREGVTLVEYLRASLAHGGFAAAEFMAAPPSLLAEISGELVPF
jgi:hypothetical protein